MEQRVDVLDMGPHEYGVTITEGTDVTYHRVTVSERLLDDLGLVDLDERALVTESVDFLLDRVPVESIGADFDLQDVADRYHDYSDEILARLAP
jgi:hypothetical protein